MASRALYGIHEVAERTGLTPELIRAWERRYGMPGTQRTVGGFRRYDEEDVERLRLLRELRERGTRITRLAVAPLAELRRLTNKGGEPSSSGESVPTSSSETDGEARLVGRLMDATSRLDAAEMRATLAIALSLLSAAEAAEKVIAPFLVRVGTEWEQGNLSVSAEHLATSVVRGTLHVLGQTPHRGSDAPRAVLLCAPDEQHDLGLLLYGLVLAAEGWEVVHLGSGLPAEDAASSLQTLAPRLVGLSFVNERPKEEIAQAVGILRGVLAPGVPLVVGGRGALGHREAVRTAGGKLCSSLYEGLALARGR